MLQDYSIICFGAEDWWYHHTHQSEHLMRRFARAGNKVVFVNSISMGLPSLAHKDLLPRVIRKMRSYLRYARDTEEGIAVVSPPTLPFFGSRTARYLNRELLAAQINALAKRRKLSRPILWLAIPTAVETIGRFDESLVVYLVVDKYDANTMDHATDPAHITRLHERALERADLILYSGRRMFEEAKRGREKSFLLEQAVDFDLFAQAANEATKIAPELEAIPRPRLGYFGAVEPWLIDQALVKKAAAERPDWQWVFIGNRARGMELDELKNVHYIPTVPYLELPRYAAGFDVCVLPWDVTNTWTSYTAPLKVREYLATGKPTVISRLHEFESMRDVLPMAANHDEFLRMVEDALNERGDERSRARQASVAADTWDARAEQVSELIEKKLTEKSAVGSQEPRV
ncbi:MAG: glycosyltransferase [Pyrinomonadaceae bacterium]